ncbi:hypothetical protein PIB30_046376 [Stylosanthes scabra]|uniref:Uncharacterized protein n=1 Tax=Stylosanthes scabra TaxID=79078 RepID=A0ABU6QFV1_9FABA|nr:hypothetical protein [Stylosanthes scabra]
MAATSQLTMEQRFKLFEEEIHELQQTTPLPKIREVPHYLRKRVDFAKHYSPKLVSFGPIHHGHPNLKLGEKYKLMWSAMYVSTKDQTARDLHERVLRKIEELKDLFDKDLFAKEEFTNLESQGFKNYDEKLSWMLFVDGCALLQIMENGKLGDAFDYPDLNIKIDQLILVRQDVLLLENQLPFQLLRLLCCLANSNNVDTHLVKSMDKFLCTHHLWPKRCPPNNPREESPYPNPNNANLQQDRNKELVVTPPVHLLDYLRKTILEDDGCQDTSFKSGICFEQIITHRNIQDLTASGIHLKKLQSRNPKHIKFSSGGMFSAGGKLELPEIIVDDTTAPTLLNLIAYEMCPDFQNDYGISSFVAFLDSLIDNPEDVKKLRSVGIMCNALGSDEEVSTLFNTLSQDWSLALRVIVMLILRLRSIIKANG